MQDEAGEEMQALLERVRTHGPVRAADFGREAVAGTGWWGWKPEKRWLEAWFALGELMVTRRDRFQRVYDLASRVRSGWPHPPATLTLDHAAVRRHFILCSVKALGITRARWIADYYRLRPRVLDAELEPLVAEGMLIRVRVAGWDADAYVHRDHASLLSHASRNQLRATRTVLLSPFDPVVWDRARARELFGFEYTIECYTPAAKRKYGYYVLPILRRGRLIGRLDAKAHRREGRFQVLGVWLEAGVSPTRALVDDVAEALRQCALWHDTPEVVIDRGQPERLAAMLRMALAG